MQREINSYTKREGVCVVDYVEPKRLGGPSMDAWACRFQKIKIREVEELFAAINNGSTAIIIP